MVRWLGMFATSRSPLCSVAFEDFEAVLQK
jgi:hypothetical protein